MRILSDHESLVIDAAKLAGVAVDSVVYAKDWMLATYRRRGKTRQFAGKVSMTVAEFVQAIRDDIESPEK